MEGPLSWGHMSANGLGPTEDNTRGLQGHAPTSATRPKSQSQSQGWSEGVGSGVGREAAETSSLGREIRAGDGRISSYFMHFLYLEAPICASDFNVNIGPLGILSRCRF